ncbi:MAG: hypothetical protein AB7V41_08340 [Burkholderiaceae bacterium]|jgi:hypothetical protein|uniref:hypothetical protein n=1 Tax=Extensimonas perlucida TaxID=2590786 RepID=UPI0016434F16|nr:hypothetical protein [Extensimonas perlucida]MBC7215982.1 hypothetical protein [Burkholderiaceae bacterium]
MSPLWHDAGLWIALGSTLVTIVAALVMRHVFIKILKEPAPDKRKELSDNE